MPKLLGLGTAVAGAVRRKDIKLFNQQMRSYHFQKYHDPFPFDLSEEYDAVTFMRGSIHELVATEHTRNSDSEQEKLIAQAINFMGFCRNTYGEDFLRKVICSQERKHRAGSSRGISIEPIVMRYLRIINQVQADSKYEFLKAMIDAGADLNAHHKRYIAKDKSDGFGSMSLYNEYPINVAIDSGDLVVAEILLKNRAKVGVHNLHVKLCKERSELVVLGSLLDPFAMYDACTVENIAMFNLLAQHAPIIPCHEAVNGMIIPDTLEVSLEGVSLHGDGEGILSVPASKTSKYKCLLPLSDFSSLPMKVVTIFREVENIKNVPESYINDCLKHHNVSRSGVECLNNSAKKSSLVNKFFQNSGVNGISNSNKNTCTI